MTRTSSSAAGRDRRAPHGRPGVTVALVGVDGAGKTTVARQLVETATWPCRYLYMGQSLASGNVLLPTSLVVQSMRTVPAARARPTGSAPRDARGRRGASRSTAVRRVRAAVVLANRLLEAVWRSWVGGRARRRGEVVVYDRYLPFEVAQVRDDPDRRALRSLDRFEEWALAHLLGTPDLVIHLDVPAEVARARKGEGSVRRLERRRRAIVAMGAGRSAFVSVDAARPQEVVLADVVAHVEAVRGAPPAAARPAVRGVL